MGPGVARSLNARLCDRSVLLSCTADVYVQPELACPAMADRRAMVAVPLPGLVAMPWRVNRWGSAPGECLSWVSSPLASWGLSRLPRNVSRGLESNPG